MSALSVVVSGDCRRAANKHISKDSQLASHCIVRPCLDYQRRSEDVRWSTTGNHSYGRERPEHRLNSSRAALLDPRYRIFDGRFQSRRWFVAEQRCYLFLVKCFFVFLLKRSKSVDECANRSSTEYKRWVFLFHCCAPTGTAAAVVAGAPTSLYTRLLWMVHAESIRAPTHPKRELFPVLSTHYPQPNWQ